MSGRVMNCWNNNCEYRAEAEKLKEALVELKASLDKPKFEADITYEVVKQWVAIIDKVLRLTVAPT